MSTSKARQASYFVDNDPVSFKKAGWPHGTVKKRVTPAWELDRLAERVWSRGRNRIRSKGDFLAVWDGFFKGGVGGDNVALREDVFERVKRAHPLKVSDSVVASADRVEKFREAGGKPLRQDFSFRATVYVKKDKMVVPVYARATWVEFRGVRRKVFRDERGRYAKVVVPD